MLELFKIFKRFEQFIKFGIVGIINTLISLAVYNILLLLNMHYLFANSVGYCVGILSSYILNSKFVFETNMDVKKGSKFILTYLSSFIIGSFILYIIVEYFNIPKTVAPLIVSIFNVIYNYIINKYWTFNK